MPSDEYHMTQNASPWSTNRRLHNSSGSIATMSLDENKLLVNLAVDKLETGVVVFIGGENFTLLFLKFA